MTNMNSEIKVESKEITNRIRRVAIVQLPLKKIESTRLASRMIIGIVSKCKVAIIDSFEITLRSSPYFFLFFAIAIKPWKE